MKIPFYARHCTNLDEEELLSCLNGNLNTDGLFTKKVLSQLSSVYSDRGSRYMLTSSCSLALETALNMCNLSKEDQVLLPSYNFPSAANAVLKAGGIPVFCDIDPDTQNISLKDIASRITSKTRAIIPVHYAGISCHMDKLLKLASEAGLVVIEDAAQAINAFYKDAALGTLGEFGCVSFHYTKNISCGEGGLLLCRDRTDFEKARCYRVHGTNRDAFFNGECDRYTWVCHGSSTAVSELCAALLSAQLSSLSQITKTRRQRLKDYLNFLKPLEQNGYARLMAVPDYASPNGHIFYLRFASQTLRERIQSYLTGQGIDAKTHYVPLHISPMGKKFGYKQSDFPETMACYDTLLRLPIHTKLTREQVWEISEIILKGIRLYG
ncbi:MAG: dTDP-4-amino-4,6-dideoxygalactose transaminase [Lachnospiraceae bacterium]|jgi:dTDP-4-amino-4,6-dideoxygalactose transaminase|nr:dTDP-4-amino-4,6-dideoxygalactose transaminase [Lachnospiraceae bacterium]